MTDSDIKNCYFVHSFFREGGYGDFDQISPLLFFTIHDGRGVQMDIVPNSLFSLFFLAGFTNMLSVILYLLYD